MTDYGRGRSKLGKIHAIDPEFTTMALCSAMACGRMVKIGSPIIDCARCLKIIEARHKSVKKTEQ